MNGKDINGMKSISIKLIGCLLIVLIGFILILFDGMKK